MRLIALLLLCSLASPLGAQRAPARPCFGVELAARCSVFGILEGGARWRLADWKDPAERDPAHAYPRLRNHGFIAAGVAWPVGPFAALGAVGEYGRDSRQALGVRYDQGLPNGLRLDFTAGAIRVETHQVGVTRRVMAGGAFGDAILHVADLAALQLRGESVAGNGERVKPGRAAYLGARIEGKAGASSSVALMAVAWIAVAIAVLAIDD